MHRRFVVVPIAVLLVACGSESPGAGSPDGPPHQPGADSPDGPPHHPGACNSLGDVGVWENITPAQVSLDPAFNTPAGDNFGVHSFVIDPLDSSTVYLGTSAQGIFKTTDCGASWVHVNTGKNGDMLDQGRQWTFVIDPVNPKNLYTNAGYSPKGGIAWKSTNAGVDWEPFISADYIKALQFGNFVHLISLDPTNPSHLIVTPHFACEVNTVNGLPKTPNCLLETSDAGATWRILEGTPGAGEGTGHWMADSKTWFWAAYFGGLYRTIDGGASWQQVYNGGYADPGGFSPSPGKWYTGGEFNVLSSPDGASWSTVKDAPGASNVTGDATTVFVSRGSAYFSAPVADPSTWTKLNSPAFAKPDSVKAWGLKYDPEHHVLYSLNSTQGFWRLRTK